MYWFNCRFLPDHADLQAASMMLPWCYDPTMPWVWPVTECGLWPVTERPFVSHRLESHEVELFSTLSSNSIVSDEFYPKEGVPTSGVLAVTCFGLKINELPSCIARDIFRALFVDDLSICFRGRSLDTIKRHLQQAVNSIQEWATRNGFRFAAHKCKVIHFTAPRVRIQRPPHCEDWKHISASGGVNQVPLVVVGFASLL